MKQRIMKNILASVGFILFISLTGRTQNFNFNCTRDTAILGCSLTACITLKGIIPDLYRLTDSYIVNSIQVGTTTCFPVYSDPDIPGNPTNLVIDDRYSSVINIGFTFPFFGSNYTSLLASTNGMISFDISKAGAFSHYALLNSGAALSATIGTPQNLPSTLYDAALIMGPYHDLDPSVPAAGQRIQYTVNGTAPYRKWILSFFRVPLYSCTTMRENTHQIVLYESTGIIEIFLFSKQICTAWNQGRSIIGIQNFAKNMGLMVPGRSASDPPWGSIGMNESWRFVPSAGPSLFKRVELYDISGNLIATGTTISLGNGQLEASFPSICAPPGVITPYVIKSVYEKIDDPAVEIFGSDTVRIDRTNAVLNANAITTATSCNTAGNGTINITNANGASPYTFILNGGPPQSGTIPFTITNVPPGNHTVVVNDASGCTTTLPVTISAGPALTTSVTKSDVLCNAGSSGTITVIQPTIGTAPYMYSLNGTTWQAGNVFTGLTVGTYTVYYRESNGCQGSQQVTINEPTAITSSINATPVVCNGQNNGVITVTASGGVSPLQYSLNGGPFQSNATFSVVAGNHTVTISDNNNCTSMQSINVTEPAALAVNSFQTNASCDGGNDGAINITATGGNPGYQYSLDGLNFQSSNVFNVAPGSYSITVRDNKGCISNTNANVGLTSNLTMTPQADKTICKGTSIPMQLTSNATQYAWSPAAGLSNITIPNPVANPTVTTQYFVTATLGKCSVMDSVFVYVNAAPIPNAGSDGFICYGQNYTLQGSGGTAFIWSPASSLSSAILASPVAVPSKTTTYTLSVTDANGCKSLVTDNVVVDVTPPIIVSVFPKDTIVYSGDQFQLLAVSAGNIYSWSPVFGLNNPIVPDPVFTVSGDVIYRVTASTIAGCKGEGTINVKMYKGPDIYMPTGFTPNGDGRNDRFKPFPVGIKQLNYFKIFNRWGQLLYSTTTLHTGWDGRFGGNFQPNAVYVWMVQGITKENKVITKKGTVSLIR